MTDWSKHVHRFAKKHNMSYKQANRSRKCKETYKKRKTSPRRKMSPRRRRTSPRRKRRMNPPLVGECLSIRNEYWGVHDKLEKLKESDPEWEATNDRLKELKPEWTRCTTENR